MQAIPSPLVDTVAQLEAIVRKYKAHERNDPDRRPPHGGFWSPRSGFVRVAHSLHTSAGMFTRLVLVGVQIGSKFGEPVGSVYPASYAARKVIVDALQNEARAILEPLRARHGGWVEYFDGSNWGALGWHRGADDAATVFGNL